MFLRVLVEDKKTIHEKLAKESLTPKEMTALFLRASEDYGYLYSKYIVDYNPEWAEGKRLPQIVHEKKMVSWLL